MIPPSYPPSTSAAEKYIFDKITYEPQSDDWLCFHSLSLAHIRGKRSGEIDFLLCVPGKGIFVLEVKGGEIWATPDGIWHYNGYEKRESPFEQARRNMYALISEIRRQFGKRSRILRIRIAYGVIVPDMAEPPVPGCEDGEKIVFNARDTEFHFRSYIDRLHSFADKEMNDGRNVLSPSEQDLDVISHWLTAQNTRSSRIQCEVHSVSEKQNALTYSQARCLDSAVESPRLIVEGGAGTGKTELAVRVVKQRSKLGSVLFLCYNRRLANALVKRFKADAVTVSTIHGFLYSLIKRSSLYNDYRAAIEKVDADHVFSEILPKYAELALAETALDKYDSIVIDEAQDILYPELMEVLDSVLIGGFNDGNWSMFLDSNLQADIYDRFSRSSLDSLQNISNTRRQYLYINCRNTKQIAKWINILAQPFIKSISLINGYSVSLYYYDGDNEQLRILTSILQRLQEEGALNDQIVILSPFSAESIAIKIADDRLHDADSKLLLDYRRNPFVQGVQDSTVSGYKGLEKEIVIMTDIRNIEEPWWRAVLYTGMSRARARLYLLVHASVSQDIEGLVHSCISSEKGEGCFA